MALETSLIHSWRMNGDSTDNQGSYDGSDTSMSYGAGRKGAQCAIFSGSGDIAITSTDFPALSTAVSVAFWFKTTDTGNNGLFGYGTADTNQMFLVNIGEAGAGKLRITQFGNSLDTTGTYNDGSWKFAVATSDSSGSYNIYVNGVLAAGPKSMTSARVIDTAYIGAYFGDVANTRLTGNMQDVCLWEKELSSAEVTQLWNGGAGMYFNGTIFVSHPKSNFLALL